MRPKISLYSLIPLIFVLGFINPQLAWSADPVVCTGCVGSNDIANKAVNANKLADNAVTANKIANGSVLKSINGLKDNVNVMAGSGMSITTNGNDLILSTITSATPITNQPLVTVSADNFTTTKIQDNSLVKVEGTIAVNTDDYNSISSANLHIFGGTFIGTETQVLQLGSNTVVSNARFENIKLDGNNIVFINCFFVGTMRLPFNSKVYGGEFQNVIQGQEYSIGVIENTSIGNSSLARVNTIVNSSISNSMIGIQNDYSFNLKMKNNLINGSKIYPGSDSIIDDNIFRGSFIDITDYVGSSIIITHNVFDNVLSEKNNIISITANSAWYRQFLITGNTFRVQDSNTAIVVSGDPAGPYYYQTLDISQNSFLKGQQAISYSGNLQTIIKNNVTRATLIGPLNNGSNLRVSINEELSN